MITTDNTKPTFSRQLTIMWGDEQRARMRQFYKFMLMAYSGRVVDMALSDFQLDALLDSTIAQLHLEAEMQMPAFARPLHPSISDEEFRKLVQVGDAKP